MRDIKLADRKYVVQSNKISQAHYNMPFDQRALVALGMAHLKGFEDMEILFNAEEAIKILKIKGTYPADRLQALRGTAKRLLKQIISVDTENGGWHDHTWIIDSQYYPDGKILKKGEPIKPGTMSLIFNPAMAPYLKDFQEAYSKLPVSDFGKLKGKYAFRLYELCMSKRGSEKLTFWNFKMTLEEIRKAFVVSGHTDRQDNFRNIVIKRTVTEINTSTVGFHINFEYIKKSKLIVGVKFMCNLEMPEKKEISEDLSSKGYIEVEYKKPLPPSEVVEPEFVTAIAALSQAYKKGEKKIPLNEIL